MMEIIDAVFAVVQKVPLYVVTLAFSFCGLVLLGLLISQIRREAHDTVGRHRSENPGVADLLNWSAVVDDGVIVNKNGSLMAAWIYRGEDIANATNAERNHVSRMINSAINQLGTGWMFHIDAVRWECPSYSPSSFSHFPDPTSMALDEERRQYFESLGTLYQGCYVLVATYFPPAIATAKFTEMMFDDPDSKNIGSQERGRRIVEQFKRDINTLEGRLSAALRMVRLKSIQKVAENGDTYTEDDFLRWLHFTLTFQNQPIVLPNNPSYIDSLVGGQDLVGGTVPVLGGKYIKVVAIDNFPFESSPGLLSKLTQLPVDYRWNTRFIFLDQHEAIAMVKRIRKKWRQKERGLSEQILRTNNGHINQDAVLMTSDCNQALLEVNSGVVAMGLFTSTVILMDEDREKVEEAAQGVQKAIAAMGFPCRIEDINSLDAFMGSLPGHGVENVRRCLMNTRHVADLIPTGALWIGSEMAPCEYYPDLSPALMQCITTGNTPFFLNLHVRDLGHTFVVGPTGSGKSVCLATIISQALRYKGMTAYVFDKGMSTYTMCKSMRKRHYNIGGEDYVDDAGNRHAQYAFSPLQYLESRQDAAWLCTWLEMMVELNGVTLTPEKRNEIAARMEVLRTSGKRTLLNFVNGLQDREMKDALQVYTRRGMMGYMLDADEDGLDLDAGGGLVIFEIEDLLAMEDPRYVLPVLLYMFWRIERSLKGQPAIVAIDEAWKALAHPVFRNRIMEWFVVWRKSNAALVLATQSLSQAVNSGIFDIICQSTATRIYLPNPQARTEGIAEIYRRMGLNNRQIEIISSAIPKRQYYLHCENGGRLFEFALGPLQRAILAVSDKDSVARVKRLEREYGDDWLFEYLQTKEIDQDTIAALREAWAAKEGVLS